MSLGHKVRHDMSEKAGTLAGVQIMEAFLSILTVEWHDQVFASGSSLWEKCRGQIAEKQV